MLEAPWEPCTLSMLVSCLFSRYSEFSVLWSHDSSAQINLADTKSRHHGIPHHLRFVHSLTSNIYLLTISQAPQLALKATQAVTQPTITSTSSKALSSPTLLGPTSLKSIRKEVCIIFVVEL